MSQYLDTVIVWFRRDLRAYDNPALVAAVNNARTVIPVYIWAAEEEGQFQPGRQTRWWAKQTAISLGKRLEELGLRLILRRARDSIDALKEVVLQTGAQAVFFNHLYDSISMVRDQQVKDTLRSMGVMVSTFNADLLYEPWEVLDDQQQPYTTFKSFWDRCLAMPYAPPLPLPEPSSCPPVPPEVTGLSPQEVNWFMTAEQEASTEALAHRWDPSVEAGNKRLEAFLKAGLPVFEHNRAKTDRESTTMLSPWIHFGSMSVRHVYYRVAQKHAEWQAQGADKGRSCLDFLQQMGYREYSRYLSFHFPFITERSMLAHLRAVPWRLDQTAYKAWRQGLTGYPLVDAGMRQLWSMGWCHNRVRVVASHFLVKHLLLPWQWGLKHLWDCQIDADLECDALGWQYVSGCLSDAHPFHYLLDLDKEWQRFDPDGHYVRRWLPVLSQLPAQYIHQPWTAPPEILEAAGVELGFNYPWPIISMEAAREGVEFASSVVERCAAPAGDSGSNKSTGGVDSVALNVMPRKEPYRPPTDPALMRSFIEATMQGTNWQEQLPPLYIPGASGGSFGGSGSALERYMQGGRGGMRGLKAPRALLMSCGYGTRTVSDGESGSPSGSSAHGSGSEETSSSSYGASSGGDSYGSASRRSEISRGGGSGTGSFPLSQVREVGEEEEDGGGSGYDDYMMSDGDSEEYVSGQPQPSMSVGTMCSRYVKQEEEGQQVTAEVAEADDMDGEMAADQQQQRREGMMLEEL